MKSKEHPVPNPEWRGATKHQREAVRKLEREITRLMGLELTYTFGGGRNCGPKACPNGPGDCSWFASRLCDVLGVDLKNSNGSTFSLADEGKAGKGKFFTLYIKNPPDPHEAHVIIGVSHGDGTRERFAQCGGRDNPTLGNGPAWFTPTKERLAEFPIRRHFKGF